MHDYTLRDVPGNVAESLHTFTVYYHDYDDLSSVKPAVPVVIDRFDLLISDPGLPDGSGYEVMESLRAQPGLKAMALSGYGSESDLARSRDAGFAIHLTKPVRVQALDEALAALFRSETSGRPEN
ncbi:MAG: response regulator [Opitutaceae bacterium]